MVGEQFVFFRILTFCFVYESHHTGKLRVIIDLSFVCRTSSDGGTDTTSYTERQCNLNLPVPVYSLQSSWSLDHVIRT